MDSTRIILLAAVSGAIGLWLARGWMRKGFKVKYEG